MIESGITSKGQTTLPKPVRQALGVQPGDRIRYAILDGKVMIMSAKPVSRLFGALKYDGPSKTLEYMDRGITEAVTERALGSNRDRY